MMADLEDIYVAMAVRQLDDEDALARTSRVQSRAQLLKDTAEAKKRHAALCEEHGLPADASPRALSDAMAKRRDEFFSGYLTGDRKLVTLCGELGLDPNALGFTPYETVWQAMRAQNHRYLRTTRDPNTGALVKPQPAPAA